MKHHLRACPIRNFFLAASLALAGWAISAFGQAPSPGSATGNLSLVRSCPIEKLPDILIPREQWHPFPALQDRAQWQALPQLVAAHLAARGVAALKKPFPPLPATLYLAFAREGNRARFESAYFERRALLQDLVFAECVESQGRFLDAVADALWAICEESTWCLPAHVGVQKARVGLADVTEPIVDLFAAESGVTVAWTLHLLGSELDRVSPQLRRRAAAELQRRIFTPVFKRNDFGWMALNITSAAHRPNNWTPWIAASVLTTTLLCESDPDRRQQIAHKMMRSLDGFLKFHPTDGGCDEGPGYWGHAGGSLLDCLEVLHSATGGKLDFFADPLVREIGRFISRAHIAGDYFVPIGDCAARFEPERALIFRYGKCIDDSSLQALAISGATLESILGDRFMDRQLRAIFAAREMLALKAATPPLLRDAWLGSEDLQLMAARSQTGSSHGLYLAAWGAHNAQSHNHNDVGNFLVFADGQPVFVDAGAPTYTAQTFSAKRYDHWAFQSAFHNLPTINSVMQGAGRQFAAAQVVCETSDTMAQLQMDLAPAYPATARVRSWLRTVRMNRGKNIELTEAFELAEITGDTSLNFLTPLEADTRQRGLVTLSRAANNDQPACRMRLEYDPTKLAAQAGRIALDDGRLAKAWGSHLNRLVLRAKSPVLRDVWSLRLIQE